MNISFGKTLSIFIFFLFVNLAWSANYYVSTTGIDGVGYGSAVGTPYRTLVYLFANKNLNAGDIVYLAAGTYTEKTITVGSDDEGFTLQGAALNSGAPTTIFDSDQTSYWIRLSDTYHDNITIKNILVKDYVTHSSTTHTYGGAGLFIAAGAKGNQVVSCVFDNCDTRNTYGHSGGAIYANDGITITDCTFKNCYAEKNGGAVAIVGASSVMSNSSINRCKFFSNTNNGSYNGIALYYATDYAYPSSSETLTIVCLMQTVV
jgi:predicted outer membrane repeat protein